MSRRRTVAEETAAGLTQQAHAEMTARGLAPRCGQKETKGSTTWTCIRAPHDGPQPYVDAHRRKHGTVNADRHIFTTQPATPTTTGDTP